MESDYSTNLNFALIDNWTLELSCQLLGGDEHPFNRYVYDASWTELHKYGEPSKEKLIALFQLLDLIVTTEELIFVKSYANGWLEDGTLAPIQPIMKEVKHNLPFYETTLGPDVQINFDFSEDDPLVREGAIFYQTLAQILGAYYWPAPQRAIFLSKYYFTNSQPNFLVSLKKTVDSHLEKMIMEVFSALNMTKPELNFSGFGSSVLTNCSSPKTILQTALEFRESKGAQSFRKWLHNMDIALQQGNINAMAQSLRDINEVVNLVNKELNPKRQNIEKVEFQIGLSPSLTIDKDLINLVFGNLKPKPYHITFLRNHFLRVLNADTWKYAKQLFTGARRF